MTEPLAKHLTDPVFDCYQFRETPLAKAIVGLFGEDIRDALKERRHADAAATDAPVVPGSSDGAGRRAHEGTGVVRPFALPQQPVRNLRAADGGPGDGPGDVDRGDAVRPVGRRPRRQQKEQPVT